MIDNSRLIKGGEIFRFLTHLSTLPFFLHLFFQTIQSLHSITKSLSKDEEKMKMDADIEFVLVGRVEGGEET